MGIQFIGAQLFNGLMLGSFYVLLSLGLSIIFGMLGVVNFAHGALYMLGAYAGYTACYLCSQNFWLAAFAFTSCFVLTLVISVLTRRSKSDERANSENDGNNFHDRQRRAGQLDPNIATCPGGIAEE